MSNPYGYPQHPQTGGPQSQIPQYAAGSYRPPLPGGLKAIAIIACILGVLGVMCKTPYNALDLVGVATFDLPGWVIAFTGVLVFLAFLASALQLAGAIGTFFLRNWARLALMTYAALALLLAVGWTVYAVLTMDEALKASEQMMQEFGAFAQNDPATARWGYIGMMVVSLLVKLIWPIVLLVVLSREKTKAAFRGETPQQPAYGYDPQQAYPQYGYPPQQQAPQQPYYGPPT